MTELSRATGLVAGPDVFHDHMHIRATSPDGLLLPVDAAVESDIAARIRARLVPS